MHGLTLYGTQSIMLIFFCTSNMRKVQKKERKNKSIKPEKPTLSFRLLQTWGCQIFNQKVLK